VLRRHVRQLQHPISTILAAALESVAAGLPRHRFRHLHVAANAPRNDVLFECARPELLKRKQRSSLVLQRQLVVGFARAGDAVTRFSCDTGSDDADARLCWHTAAGSINIGYRCGANTGLNGDAGFERVIFQAP